MSPGEFSKDTSLSDLRLFLEEICCDLCRFRHMQQDSVPADAIRTRREVYLGAPHAYAHIQVEAHGCSSYFLEVKYGYTAEEIVKHLTKKYGNSPKWNSVSKVIAVVHSEEGIDWTQIGARIQSGIHNFYDVEIWDENYLFKAAREYLDADIPAIADASPSELRNSIDDVKGKHAFGDAWENTPLQLSQIWRFGFWRIPKLLGRNDAGTASVVLPGYYENVVVLNADLSTFSSYVRDTSATEVIHHTLVSFYSKTRHQVLDTGGMMYQFLGDAIIGIYGIPDYPPNYIENSLECARALVDVGNSICDEWQRHLDRAQKTKGVHIGITLGEIQIVPERPFSRTYLSAVSDTINMSARLGDDAGPSEILVNNSFYHALSEASQGEFVESEPVRAQNMGMLKAWRLVLGQEVTGSNSLCQESCKSGRSVHVHK
jgi:adenylate cyclase